MGIIDFFIGHLRKPDSLESETDSIIWTKQEDGTYTSNIPGYEGMLWEKQDNGDFLLIDDIHPNENYCEYHHRLMERNIRCGLMPKGMKKVWSVASLGRVCTDCLRLDGKALDMDEKFTSGDASVLYPPLHDGCRCVLKYIEPDRLKGYSETHRNIALIKRCEEYIANAIFVYDFWQKHTALLEAMERVLHDSTPPTDEESILFLSKLPERYHYLITHKIEMFNDTIDRQYAWELEDASKLKTEWGKQNRINRFFESVAVLPIPEGSIEYAKRLCESYVP